VHAANTHTHTHTHTHKHTPQGEWQQKEMKRLERSASEMSFYGREGAGGVGARGSGAHAHLETAQVYSQVCGAV
jgi:hypothetical protein